MNIDQGKVKPETLERVTVFVSVIRELRRLHDFFFFLMFRFIVTGHNFSFQPVFIK